MNRPTHFELQADDPERAIRFYTDVFGWEFQKWDGSPTDYWMIMTAPKDSKDDGINGGLLKRPAKTPPQECGTNAAVLTMVVEDYDATAKKAEAAGAVVAMPKFALAGMAWQGYYLDTERNTFGIHQADPNAK
jgi:predicted enzyme related to lactoylglutathione lyase